jgi:FkbM family methyltransferase
MNEYIKHLLIRTPLERPLTRLRDVLSFGKRLRHPEMREIFLEPERTDALLAQVLRPDSNCVDVGAHLGSMSNAFLKAAPRGKHTAFEALPHKAQWLVRKFPEVTVHNLALSDTAGTLTFYQNLTHSGFSGLQKHDHHADDFRELRVQCRLLDDVLPRDYRVDFLKVDVEGAELSVFRGAERVLRECRPILFFECTRSGLDQFELTPMDVLEFLAGRGYSVYLIKDYLGQGPALDRTSIAEATVYPFKAFNFVAAANA